MRPLIISILALISFHYTLAQHAGENESVHHVPIASMHHKLTAVMAYSLILNSIDENADLVLIVPTIGLNYDYWFHSKWGIGLHNDIVLQQFKVEKHEGHEELIRENPVAICAMGLYSPARTWTVMAGYGIELETHESIQLLRLGFDYGVHLINNWELGFALEFDYKFKTYSSWMFGIGFSKLLSKS